MKKTNPVILFFAIWFALAVVLIASELLEKFC